jgi:ribosomal protein L37AE/L43A
LLGFGMGNVISLDTQRPPATEVPLLYHCQRCGSREFTLHASGVTYCGSCGALMRNLLVVPAP